MACVNVPVHAMAPISRLMARVWGNNSETHPAAMYADPKVALAKPEKEPQQASASPPKEVLEPKVVDKVSTPRRTKEVRVDSTTTVPMDLYWSLLRAGERAKNRGQHRLVECGSRTSSRHGAESPRPRLVRSF
eukprot:TRINITY_DN41900_c0_g1_i1.p1 TRINITY_DN41900_c0_g1~~TRINITY_DN41900_c0_g1_i1.p1  ORF type:complete len:133 (-),score=16.77 TRINITY_DN41900_c0_g1_i1:136-534(-)